MLNPTPLTHRVVGIVGVVLLVVAMIWWYSTPAGFVAPPLILGAIGLVLAGYYEAIRRARAKKDDAE